MGFPAYYGPATKLFIDCSLTALRLVCLKRIFPSFSLRDYVKRVFLPIGLSVVVVVALLFVLHYYSIISNRLLLTVVVLGAALFSSYFIGLSSQERALVLDYGKKILSRVRKD